MIKASIYCGFTVTVAMFTIVFLRDNTAIDIDMDLVSGVFLGACLICIIGFVFCLILLVPLVPLFKRTSLTCSLIIFSTIGFFVPAYLSYLVDTIPFHGETPGLYRQDNIQAIMNIFYGGITGAVGATSAWFSLKWDSRVAEET